MGTLPQGLMDRRNLEGSAGDFGALSELRGFFPFGVQRLLRVRLILEMN